MKALAVVKHMGGVGLSLRHFIESIPVLRVSLEFGVWDLMFPSHTAPCIRSKQCVR